MAEEKDKPGEHRKVGEERTEISPGTRKRILAQDGKTKEIPNHKKDKK